MRTQIIIEKLLVAFIAILILMAIYHMVYDGAFDPVALASAVTMVFSAYAAHRHAPRFIAAKYYGKDAK